MSRNDEMIVCTSVVNEEISVDKSFIFICLGLFIGRVVIRKHVRFCYDLVVDDTVR